MATDQNKKAIIAALGVALSIMFYFAAPQEGMRYVSYKDGGGVWTICKGHTKGVYEHETATDTQCREWYIEDIADANSVYSRLVQVEQHPNVKAASIDFIFNAGAGNFSRSTLRKKLNKGDRLGACSEFPKWYMAGGKDCRMKSSNCGGIVVRRKNEKELCLSNEISVCDFSNGSCVIADSVQGSQLASGQP